MRRGISVAEILVAIVIMALLLGIGIPEFQKWQAKEKVKEDVNCIYTVLQTLRNRAFTRKVNYTVTINGTAIRIKGAENATYMLNFPFNSSHESIFISSKGTFNKQTTIKCCKPVCRQTTYNCVVVNFHNLRIDKCDCP